MLPDDPADGSGLGTCRPDKTRQASHQALNVGCGVQPTNHTKFNLLRLSRQSNFSLTSRPQYSWWKRHNTRVNRITRIFFIAHQPASNQRLADFLRHPAQHFRHAAWQDLNTIRIRLRNLLINVVKRNRINNKQSMNTEKPSALAAFSIEALVLIIPSASVTSFKTESPLLYLTRLPANQHE